MGLCFRLQNKGSNEMRFKKESFLTSNFQWMQNDKYMIELRYRRRSRLGSWNRTARSNLAAMGAGYTAGWQHRVLCMTFGESISLCRLNSFLCFVLRFVDVLKKKEKKISSRFMNGEVDALLGS